MPELTRTQVLRAARRAGEARNRTEVLAFGLAGETYGVEIHRIVEILRPPPITQVPRAPDSVLGVVGVRGKLVTVVDLRRRFKLPAAPMDRKTRILLFEAETGEQVGLLVDEVQQVWRLSTEEIEPASVLGGEQAPYIAGLARPTHSRGTVLILLELQPILETL